MSTLPTSERLLLGPGPSMISPRVMRALAAPVLGHLDPDLMAMMDKTRDQLRALFRAPEGAFAFAVSGTGTSGLEAAVANLVQDGTRVLAVVTGYFGDRLASSAAIRGPRDAARRRVGPGVRSAARAGGAGAPERGRSSASCTRRPRPARCTRCASSAHGAVRSYDVLLMADCVTSLGGVPLDVGRWGVDYAYSCTQKCLAAPGPATPRRAPGGGSASATARCRWVRLDLEPAAPVLGRAARRLPPHQAPDPCMSTRCTRRCGASSIEGLEARWGAPRDGGRPPPVRALRARGLDLLADPRRPDGAADGGARPGRRRRQGRADAHARRGGGSRSAAASAPTRSARSGGSG